MSGDPIDKACDLEQKMNEIAIQEQQLKAKQGIGDPVDHCVDCGGDIPEGRKKALLGVQHCISCAHRIEQKRRLYL